MPFLQSRAGGDIWYLEEGAGRPLLFVHGWCMSGAVWQLQQRPLADRYRVITVDLRGHGRSSAPQEGMGGIDGLAGDLLDLVQLLDLRDLVAVGWSLGAQLLLTAYTRAARRFAGMVLVGATPRFTAAPDFPYGLPVIEAQGMRLKIRRNLARALDGFHQRLFVAGELDEATVGCQVAAVLADVVPPTAAAALDGLEALMGAEMLQEATRVQCPTLLIHGEQDRICLPDASLWLARAVPDSRRIVYPGCGHAPFLSRPERFNRDLIEFMEGLRDRQ